MRGSLNSEEQAWSQSQGCNLVPENSIINANTCRNSFHAQSGFFLCNFTLVIDETRSSGMTDGYDTRSCLIWDKEIMNMWTQQKQDHHNGKWDHHCKSTTMPSARETKGRLQGRIRGRGSRAGSQSTAGQKPQVSVCNTQAQEGRGHG